MRQGARRGEPCIAKGSTQCVGHPDPTSAMRMEQVWVAQVLVESVDYDTGHAGDCIFGSTSETGAWICSTNSIPFKKNEILNAKKDHCHQVLSCVVGSKTIQKLK